MELNIIDLILVATFTGFGTALGNKVFKWFDERKDKVKETLNRIAKKNESKGIF